MGRKNQSGKRIFLSVITLLVITSLLLTQFPPGIVTAQTDTSVDWPSYRHDPAGTSFADGETQLAPPLELSLTIPLSSPIQNAATPILANGYLFILEEDGLCAYTLADQSRAWCFDGLENLILSGVTGPEIIIAGTNPVDGTFTVVRLALTDGSALGQVETALTSSDSTACSAAADDQLFCALDDFLLKIDLTSNSVSWTLPLDGQGTAPVLSEDIVFVNTDASTWAVSRVDGAVIWNSLQSAGSMMLPLVFGWNLLVAGSEGIVHALDVLTGAPAWSHTVSAGDPCQAAYGNTDLIITTSAGLVEKLNATDGTLLWSFDAGITEEGTCPSLVLANTYAFIGNLDGTLKVLELNTGTLAWEGSISTPGFVAGLAVSDGKLALPVSPSQVSFYALATTPTEAPPVGDPSGEVTYSISGNVFDIEGAQIPGIQVVDGLGNVGLTDETGAYTITNLVPGEVTLTPMSDSYDFTPESSALTITDADLTDVNFVGTQKSAGILEGVGTLSGAEMFPADSLAPEIVSLNPSSVIVGDPAFTTLTVHGANFVATSTVMWDATALVTTFVSDTELTAVVTPDLFNTPAEIPIMVVNPEPEGGSSVAVLLSVENPLPLLYALSPSYSITRLPTDTGITLEVIGANFVPGSQVLWDGIVLDTVFLSPTQLTAEVPVLNLLLPMQVPITVANPAPGGGVSSQLVFHVDQIHPADGQKLAVSKVNFDWPDIPDANAYHIQMSLYSDFSKLLINGPVYSSHYHYGRALINGNTYYWRYCARTGDLWSDWTPTYTFYSMNPPPAPVLSIPNRYLTNDNEPLLTWNEALNAEKYQVQISRNYKFTSNVQDVIIPDRVTSFKTAALADGLYYWRVRGIDSVGVNGAWSGYRSFRIDTLPPATPQPTSPLDGAFINTTTPTLSLGPVSEASSYCFQVADSEAFDNILVNPVCEQTTASTSWTVPAEAMLGYQTYFWRAMAIDAAGNFSTPATAQLLNITLMQAPADSSFIADLTPEFSWVGLPEAIEYHLQVSTEQAFVPPNLIDEELSSTTFTPIDDLGFGIYYLRLEADTGTGFTGNWMPVQRFTISPVPMAPVLLTPVNGSLINDRTPLLDWSEEETPAIPLTGYEVQLSTDTAFATIVHSAITVGAPPYESVELADGVYYWRVRAINELNAPGEWSLTASFRLDSTPVKPPPYYSPANGATTTTTIPKFTVKKVRGAVTYRFQVALEPSFAEPVLLDRQVKPGITSASYALTEAEALPFGTLYWRAATVDTAGNEAWGEPRSLVVNILQTPKNGGTTSDQTPTFSWGAAAGTLQYEIQAATDPAFDAGSIVISELLIPSTSYTPASAMAPGNYYWRMRTNTGAGFSENWTPVFSFIVTPVTPSVPYIMEPASGIYINDASPRLRWVEAFTLTAPQLRINTRTVQVYLPPDYATSGKSYPVIYLNDGNSKFINGYYVDDTLEELFRTGQIKGVIAVAIFNSSNRWDEYSPWVNTHMRDVWYAWNAASSEGGEGDAYVDFLVDTLKPIIDSRYRTLPDREHTAIGGGSMGGLISLYTALREPQVFSKVMAFSPAVWFGEVGGTWLSNNRLINYIMNHPVPEDTKFFIYTGTNEWNGRTLGLPGMTYPQVWVSGARAVRSAIENSDPDSEVYYVENPGGIHTPSSWRWWVDEAVNWFFADITELPDSPPELDGVAEDHYEIQFSTSSRFSTIEHTGYTLDGQLSYDGALLEDGRHYWRVRAINDVGAAGAWSSIKYFYIDSKPPDPPQLYTPIANGFSYDTTPALSVRADGAYQYCFQVANSASFDNILVNPDCSNRSSRITWSVPSANMLPYGENYYWRVAAYDRAGNVSNWSEVRQLTISIMRSPVDHSNTTNIQPTFVWAAMAGGQKYHLQVSTDPAVLDPDSIVLDVERPPSTYYTPLTPFAVGQYYWRMRVMFGGTYGNWMPVQTFTISPVPAAPTLSAPGTGSLTNDKTPVLSWNPVIDPYRLISGYQVQVSRSSRFTTSVIEEVEGATSYESNAITADGRYYWRVRAVNDLGVMGRWSSARSIVIDTTPPKIPSLIIPLDGATIHGLPFYYWLSDSTAKYHQFEFATDPGFTNIEYRTGELTVTYHILPGQKPGTYYWHTRARDAAGNWSDWSEPRLVTIAP